MRRFNRSPPASPIFVAAIRSFPAVGGTWAFANDYARLSCATTAPDRRGGHGRGQELRLPGAGDPRLRPAGAKKANRRARGHFDPYHQPPRAADARRTCRFSRSVMPLEFTAVLVKGRGNYLSLRRLENALGRAAQPVQRAGGVRSAAADRTTGRKQTADGSLSDLDFRPLPPVWDEVASDHGNCMGRNCPMYNECFYYRARRRMQQRPDPGRQPRLVLHRPGAAARERQHPAGVRRGDLRRGPHHGSRGRRSPGPEHHQRPGRIHAATGSTTTAPTAGCWCITSWATPSRQVVECRDRADDFFETWPDWLAAQARRQRPGAPGRRSWPMPLSEGLGHAGRHDRRPMPGDRRSPRSARTSPPPPTGSTRLAEGIERVAGPTSLPIGLLDRATLPAASRPPDHAGRGADRRRARSCASTSSTKVPTVIMTSATLATGGSFEFFKSRVGLTQTETLCLGSPFDYQQQAQLILLDGMPDPTADAPATSGRRSR